MDLLAAPGEAHGPDPESEAGAGGHSAVALQTQEALLAAASSSTPFWLAPLSPSCWTYPLPHIGQFQKEIGSLGRPAAQIPGSYSR